LHASTARETIIRLQNEPMNVPEVLVNLVDVFVVMRRYNINGKVSRVVGELVETAGMADKMILLSTLWTYDLGSNSFKESSVGSEYRDRLALVSGKTTVEIMEELKVRSGIIRMMMKKGIKEMKEVTEFFHKYIGNSREAAAALGVK